MLSPGSDHPEPVPEKTDWRSQLPDERYHILFEAGT